MSGGALTIPAYAKINLTLEVLGRRPDGYHEILSIMQTISLCDDVALEPSDSLSLVCEAPGLSGQDNLALKAAMLLQSVSGYPKGAKIGLTKRIPVAAGLGGGSSDAAAVLAGLNRLWGIQWPKQKLAGLAAQLGSDIPFFVYGGTALAEGRGERITSLLPMPKQWLVLLSVPIEVPAKTKTLYSRLQPSNYTTGRYAMKVREFLAGGKTLPSVLLYNAFERVALELLPELSKYWQRFIEAGAQYVHLAGSGPTLYAMVEDETEGRALRTKLQRHGLTAHLVHTVTPLLP